MNSRVRKWLVRISVTVAVCVASFFALLRAQTWEHDREARRELRRDHPGYLEWRRDGGPWRYGFDGALLRDRHRDTGLAGLSVEQILAKYPFLVDSETYPEKSPERSHWKALRNRPPDARVLWVPHPDGWPVCVVFQNGVAHWEVHKG